MGREPHSNLESGVAGIARSMGYNVTFHPSETPNRGAWAHRISLLMRGHRFVPDLLVEHHGNFVFVECKETPALLGGVMPFLRFIAETHTHGILCFPDGVFHSMPGSIPRFAGEANVRLCPMSEVRKALRDVLG